MGSGSTPGVAGQADGIPLVFPEYQVIRAWNPTVCLSPGISRDGYPVGRLFPPGVGFHRPAISDVITADGVTPGVRFRE